LVLPDILKIKLLQNKILSKVKIPSAFNHF